MACKQVQSLAKARCAVDAACILPVSPFRVVAGVAQSSLRRILFVVGTIKRPAPASRWHPEDFDVFFYGAVLFAFRRLTYPSCERQFSVSTDWRSYSRDGTWLAQVAEMPIAILSATSSPVSTQKYFVSSYGVLSLYCSPHSGHYSWYSLFFS